MPHRKEIQRFASKEEFMEKIKEHMTEKQIAKFEELLSQGSSVNQANKRVHKNKE